MLDPDRLAIGLPGLVAGYGLLKHKPWARVLAIVVGILGLVNFPVGTAIGLYAFWVLTQPAATDYFAAAGATERMRHSSHQSS